MRLWRKNREGDSEEGGGGEIFLEKKETKDMKTEGLTALAMKNKLTAEPRD